MATCRKCGLDIHQHDDNGYMMYVAYEDTYCTDGGEHEPLWTPVPPPSSVNAGLGWFDPFAQTALYVDQALSDQSPHVSHDGNGCDTHRRLEGWHK